MLEQPQQDLGRTMRSLLEIRPSPVKILPQLKFRNTIYSSGDDILLIQNLESNEPLYARVLCIAKIPTLQFPVLLVAWYLTKNDPLLEELGTTALSKKQLVLSNQTDWQYMQSVKGKLQVLPPKQFLLLQPRQKDRREVFVCGSYWAGREGFGSKQHRACQCFGALRPEEKYSICVLCGLHFHSGCSRQQQICLGCS